MQNSFVFYRSFLESLEDVDDATFRKLMTALVKYALDGEDTKLSGLEKAWFVNVKANVDANIKRRNDGKKGGRPTKEKTKVSNNETMVFDNKSMVSEEKPQVLDSEPNVYVDVYVDEDVDVDAYVDGEENIVSKDTTSETDDAVTAVIEKWNSTSFTEVSRLSRSSNRYKMLIARLKEYGIDNVLKAIDIANASDYLHSEKAVSWFDFEWFVRPNNFPKIFEGKYNNNKPDSDNGWGW